MSELGNFIVSKRNIELTLNAVSADNGKCAETYVADAVLAVHHCGNGEVGVNAAEETFADMTYGDSDSIESSALVCNDLSAGLSCVFLDSSVVNYRTLVLGKTRNIILNGNAGDVCERPGHERRIAVLTEYISVNVLVADVESLCKTCTETDAVESCTRTDDVVSGKTGGLVELVGKNIDRVAYDDIDSVGGILNYLGDNRLCDVNVCLSELETRLTGLSCNAGGKNNNVRILSVLICACINGAGGAERNALNDIHSLAVSLVVVDINKNDLGSYAVNDHSIGNSGADAACADNSDFVAHKSFPAFCEYFLCDRKFVRRLEYLRRSCPCDHLISDKKTEFSRYIYSNTPEKKNQEKKHIKYALVKNLTNCIAECNIFNSFSGC